MMKGSAHIQLVSLDWHSAVIRFALPQPSHVEVTTADNPEIVLGKTVEPNAIGRLELSDLLPDTEYCLRVSWEGGEQDCVFRTLPVPEGPMRSSLAIVADPHLSLQRENRKGRLFVESATILGDIVDACTRLDVSAMLLPGDITNRGLPGEFALAAEVFRECAFPILSAPGDHDLPPGSLPHWRDTFGPERWNREIDGLHVIGLDTSQKTLGDSGCKQLEEGLASSARAIVVVSHSQLVPDEYIQYGKTKGILDADDHRDLLAALTERPTLVYAGHQNVPVRARQKQLLQLNLPQTLQYPCGWVLVREYDNGFYHTFQPIQSEILNEYSRLASNDAARRYDQPQWQDAYREGPTVYEANFRWAPPGS